MPTSTLKKSLLILTIMLCIFMPAARAQSMLFSRLNTSQGLSENNARSLAIDRNGFLWIGTSDGLNVYDGYSISSFHKEDFPALGSNVILHLITDSRNRVWIGTPEGASWLDENRNFHKVTLDTFSRYYCANVFETARYGMIVYTDKGQFFFDSTANRWQELKWIPAPIKTVFLDAEVFSANQIIFTMDSLVAVMDYSTKKIIYQAPYIKPVTACKVNEEQIAIGLQTGQVLVVNIVTGQVVRQYQLTQELNGQIIDSYLSEVRMAANGDLLVATDFSGLVVIDKNGNIKRHTHDPLNPGSISSNYTYRVLPGPKGEVIVGTYASGASMSNIYNKAANYTRIFKDQKGQMFDNYVSNLAVDKEGTIWFGSLDRLVRWDRKTNTSAFYSYYFKTLSQGLRPLEIRPVCVDPAGRIFVGAYGVGLARFDKKTEKFTAIQTDSTFGPAARSRYVYDIIYGTDGRLWVASNGGLYTVDPATSKITQYEKHPLLKEATGKRVNTVFEDSRGRIWIGTNISGMYCYDPKSDTLEHYWTQNGLPSNSIYCFAEDKAGNIFASTAAGLSILNGKGVFRSINKESGLRYDNVQDIQSDTLGNIWIANNKCMIRFNLAENAIQYYEENTGFSNEGFRIGSSLKTKDGELIWGGRGGVSHFYPWELVSIPSLLNLSIYSVTAGGEVSTITRNRDFSLPYSGNDLTINFSAVNLYGSRHVRYQYRLEGFEEQWHTGIDTREAHYTALPSGDFRFIVRASMDGKTWTESNNIVRVTIIPPIWERWWFIASCTLILGGSLFWLLENRNRMILRQKEEIETEQAINFFATNMYQQQSVESILWEVARNCIGRLHFEDCVIYLVDEQRRVLVQKAAHGPKSPKTYEIADPIDIPIGKGIVGSVALTGRAEIVPDTTRDPRYIVDDQQRYSEITVPIISDGQVIGIIDCEHSKKGFFTQKHLSILNTIASLCANKITRTRAEEEKELAQEILMDTQRKMAEVEMQALRAQMNPHFIFNCLNSINRYIVKSDQATASLYLTRFAKLIRLILDNSNSKNVILANELEALRLYIEMEALRFDKKFSYQINVAADINPDGVEVPPLIIQPYVENAIWHGLLHKESGGMLKIDISRASATMICCVIEDNGIGRERAKELKSKSATTRKSLGMKLTENRLSLLNKYAEVMASVEIIDLLKNGEEEPEGTRVVLKIPVL
jgi:ligand-binding sensor domain-containing protein/putative methionine-R-sulfoxide reductase with GAF domain